MPIKFNIKDYKELLIQLGEYDREASRIFDKLHSADLASKTKILHYGKYASIERIEWDYSDDKNICIRYYDSSYDLDDSATLNIPVHIFGNDSLIDEWINSKIKEAKELQRQAKEKQQLAKEAREKAEYERLKAKFENGKQILF